MGLSLARKCTSLYCTSFVAFFRVGRSYTDPIHLSKFLSRHFSLRINDSVNIKSNADTSEDVMKENKNQLCFSEERNYDNLLKICRVTKSKGPLLTKEIPSSFLKSKPKIFKEQTKHDKFRSIISEQCEEDVNKQLAELARRTGQTLASIKVYGHLIHLFALQKDFLKAQKTFDAMMAAGINPNEQIYNSLMNAYANCGKLKETLETFNLLQSDLINVTVYPYGILIKAYMKHNRVQDAFEVIDSMRQKIQPDTSIYNALIQACIKAHDFKRSWVAYELMLKDDCQPSILTYALLLPIAQKENLEKASNLFEEMLGRGMTPNLKIVNSFLSALSSRPDYYATSIELLDFLITQKQFSPDVYTFNIMLSGAQLKRNIKDARYFFYNVISSSSPPAQLKIAYCKVFQAYSLAFPLNRLERTAHQVDLPTKDFDFLLNPSPTSIEGCVNEVLMLMPSFKKLLADEDPIQFGRSWGSLLLVFTNYNYFNEAMKYSEMIYTKCSGPSHASNYKVMLEICTRLHKRDAFFKILKEAKAILEPIEPKSTLTFREKIEFKHAHQLSSESVCNLYRKVVEGLAKFNELSSALQYFEAQVGESKSDWLKHKKVYFPFFRKVENSKDPELIARLHELFAKSNFTLPSVPLM